MTTELTVDNAAATRDESLRHWLRPLRSHDPRGTTVLVTLSNGDPWLSATRSRVYRARGGALCVLLEGRTAAFLATQCEVPTERKVRRKDSK